MRLFLHELRAQQTLFWRNREAAFFSFLFPILLLLLLGSAYGDTEIEGVRGATYLVVGLIGYGLAATAFASLAITLVVRREQGLLKRVRGTPLPPATYLAAVIASTVVVIALQVTAQVLIGRFVLDADLPEAVGSLAAAVALGAASFAALGLAVTGLVRSAEGSSAVVNAIYLPMAFLSGAFFSTDDMPQLLEWVAAVLPLTHLLDVIRDAYVGGESVSASAGAAAAVAAWGLAGLAVAVRMFRWEPREGMTGA
ncbi:MAG TPA: ABC transporter permease [Gaiellaceae bacterium]|jgi:ABC-2 type transport system permease protein|nr:ABC transporter permease [Gaiellaceae bacterium]